MFGYTAAPAPNLLWELQQCMQAKSDASNDVSFFSGTAGKPETKNKPIEKVWKTLTDFMLVKTTLVM